MTIEQLGTYLGLIAGIITSIGIILVPIKKSLIKAIEPINNNIKELDIGQCKNFLVRFLADVEQGHHLDEVEKERAYEVYDHYTNDLNQNSYIHKRWNELMEVKK